MSLFLDIGNALSTSIGTKHGVSKGEITSLQKKATHIHNELKKQRNREKGTFYDLPYDTNTVEIVKAISQAVRRKYEYFVHIAMGGGCLGPQLMATSLMHTYHGLCDKRHMIPRFFFVDNPDSRTICDLLEVINLSSTAFFVVSKSGCTDQTLAIFMILYSRLLKRLGSNAVKERFVIATAAHADNSLHTIAEKENLRILPLPDEVSGPFSVFTAAGLYPAAVAGGDIDKILRGAIDMDKRTQTAALNENPAYLNAAVHALLHQKHGKNYNVILPYSDSLRHLNRWYQHLWARGGGRGIAFCPDRQLLVAGTITVDHHYLLPLYLHGPNDKSFTFVCVKKPRSDVKIPNVFRYEKRLDYLRRKALSEVIGADLVATRSMLTYYKRPNVTITLDKLDEYHLGALLYMYQVQTAFAGALYEVDPFEEPPEVETEPLLRSLLGSKEKVPSAVQKMLKQSSEGKK